MANMTESSITRGVVIVFVLVKFSNKNFATMKIIVHETCHVLIGF